MTRTTIMDLSKRVNFANEILARQNRNFRLNLNGRYDYTAVDYVSADPSDTCGYGTLVAGTKHECMIAVNAFIAGMSANPVSKLW